jgi:hypothetical protein
MLTTVMQDGGSGLFIIQLIHRRYSKNIMGYTISPMRSIAIVIQQSQIEQTQMQTK